MDKEAINIFLDKKVKVQKKSDGWFYTGWFKTTSDGIVVDDFKVGSIFIDYDDINSMVVAI